MSSYTERRGIKVKTEIMDCGAKIGVAVEFNGKRRAVLIDNPLWESREI